MIGRYKPPRRWSDRDLLGPMALIHQAINRINNAEDKRQAELIARFERLMQKDRERRP